MNPFVMLVGAIVAVVVGKSVYDRIHEGGGLVVTAIGPKEVGKTTLISFLKDGRLPESVSRTTASEEYEVKVGDHDWLLAVTDTSGSRDKINEWTRSKQARATDVLWFVASAADLRDGKLLSETQRNLRVVAAAKLPAKTVLVITHGDLDPSYDGQTDESLSVISEVRGLEVMLHPSRRIVGSLESEQAAAALKDRLLDAMGPLHGR